MRLEPGGLVNVVRRDGAPLRAASADGRIVYQEGRDFQNARDPKLGMIPWPGGFTAWHDPPVVDPASGQPHPRRPEGLAQLLPHGAHLRGAGHVLHGRAEALRDPPLADRRRSTSTSSRTAISSSTTRSACRAGTKAAARRAMTPGELLAENVRKCVALVRHGRPGQADLRLVRHVRPDATTPQKTGRYYLVKGDGPWYGSWKGLDKDVVIVNWNSDPAKRVASLRHFAGLGHRQILAGYYDGPVAAIRGWLRDGREVKGIAGVMYTTWQHRYGDLEAFARYLQTP